MASVIQNLYHRLSLRNSLPPQPAFGSSSPTLCKNKLPSVSQLINPQQRNTLTPSSMTGGLTDSKGSIKSSIIPLIYIYSLSTNVSVYVRANKRSYKQYKVISDLNFTWRKFFRKLRISESLVKKILSGLEKHSVLNVNLTKSFLLKLN